MTNRDTETTTATAGPRALEGAAPAVLLTGVTGFLGTQLLYELLEHGDMPVTCLVRGADLDGAERALVGRLGWFFPGWDVRRHRARLKLVLGDVSEPHLGLSPLDYERLSQAIALVVNSAANVNHAGAAAQFFRVNTDAVLELIAFARRGAPKALHQVSTVDVRGQFAASSSLAAFRETHLNEGQSFRSPYAESKFRAELALRQAFGEGLRGAVYRVGYIAPHSETGRFQQNIQQNYIARYVRAVVRLGFAPYLPERKVRLTPVDSVARAIHRIMTRAESRGQTYYLETPHAVTQYDVVRVLQAAGYPIRLLALDDFNAKAARISQDSESLLALSAGSKADPAVRAVPIDSSWSQSELARLGFEYPRTSSRWIGDFLRHALEVGFLEAPRFWHLGPVVADLL